MEFNEALEATRQFTVYIDGINTHVQKIRELANNSIVGLNVNLDNGVVGYTGLMGDIRKHIDNIHLLEEQLERRIATYNQNLELDK